MTERYRENEEANEALDPELLYSKEYCIGWFYFGHECVLVADHDRWWELWQSLQRVRLPLFESLSWPRSLALV